MKNLLLSAFAMIGISLNAAVPSFSDFNTNQFSVAGNKVVVKSGASITNPIVTGTVTADAFSGSGSNITGVAYVDEAGSARTVGTSVGTPALQILAGTPNDYIQINSPYSIGGDGGRLTNVTAEAVSLNSGSAVAAIGVTAAGKVTTNAVPGGSSGATINFVWTGSSLTMRGRPGGDWPTVFMPQYPFFGRANISTNVGIDGGTSYAILASYTNSIQPWKPKKNGDETYLTVIGGEVNSIWMGTNVDTIWSEVTNLWTLCTNDRIQVIHGTPTPYAGDYGTNRDEIQRRILANAHYWGVRVVRVDRLFPSLANTNDFWDTLHFTTNAQARLSKEIAAVAPAEIGPVFTSQTYNQGETLFGVPYASALLLSANSKTNLVLHTDGSVSASALTVAAATNNTLSAGTNSGLTVDQQGALTVYTATPATASGCIDLWSMENNFADSVGSNNGSSNSTYFAFAAGKVNQAVSISGSSWIKTGTNDMNFGSGDFSIVSWIKCSSALMAVCAWDSVTPSLWLDSTGHLEWFDGSGFHTAATASVSDGNWHQLAMTRSSGTITYYVDGASAGSGGTDNNAYHPAVGFAIGNGSYTEQNSPFTGSLDEFALYNTALSGAQIASLYGASGITMVPRIYLRADGVIATATNATIHAGMSGQCIGSNVGGTNYWVIDIGGGNWKTNHIP